jgi:hypothetical protein
MSTHAAEREVTKRLLALELARGPIFEHDFAVMHGVDTRVARRVGIDLVLDRMAERCPDGKLALPQRQQER